MAFTRKPDGGPDKRYFDFESTLQRFDALKAPLSKAYKKVKNKKRDDSLPSQS
jgi:hypothetical protein